MVLLSALLLLLLMAIGVFSALEVSNLQLKLSIDHVIAEQLFLSSETVVEEVLSSPALLSAAYNSSRAQLPWPNSEYRSSVTSASDLSQRIIGRAEVRFVSATIGAGNSMRRGAPGLRQLHYEVHALAALDDSSRRSYHVQGVYIEVPQEDRF